MIAVTIRHSDRCLTCEHPVSARTPDALTAAVRDHVAFVNTTKDRATDEHFAEARINRLVAD